MRTSVISLKRSIEAHEEQALLFRKTLESYVFALDTVWRHTKDVAGILPQPRLREVKESLQVAPTVAVLDESRVELELGLRRIAEATSWQEAEIRKILKTLAHATESLTNRNDHHGSHLRGLATQLESLAATEDLLLLRIGLTTHVKEFRDCIEQMHAENRQGLEQLTNEMAVVRERLHKVEEQANTDQLTGLLNRRNVEGLLNDRVAGRKTFSIVLLDLNRFKAINDRYGHLTGDQTLKEFAARLKTSLRPKDLCCRWGGDEFLVVLDCPLPDAISISRRILQCVVGRYSLVVAHSTVKVDVSASVGLAEYKQGETVEQLFARADAGLYEAKGPR